MLDHGPFNWNEFDFVPRARIGGRIVGCLLIDNNLRLVRR
jgi:hypothetical protein